MSTARETPGESGFRWLFLLNVVIVAALALPLVFAYPALFARLDIASLENGFFAQIAGGFLFAEAVASYLAWRRMERNVDMVWVIIFAKGAFILIVLAAFVSGSLPSSAFVAAAVVDLLLSIAFAVYLRSATSTTG